MNLIARLICRLVGHRWLAGWEDGYVPPIVDRRYAVGEAQMIWCPRCRQWWRYPAEGYSPTYQAMHEARGLALHRLFGSDGAA